MYKDKLLNHWSTAKVKCKYCGKIVSAEETHAIETPNPESILYWTLEVVCDNCYDRHMLSQKKPGVL